MTELTATFVKDLTGWQSSAKLWELSREVEDGYCEVTTRFIITSKVIAYSGPETYIFPSDPEGDPLSMLEMPGSMKGVVSHEESIKAFIEAHS